LRTVEARVEPHHTWRERTATGAGSEAGLRGIRGIGLETWGTKATV